MTSTASHRPNFLCPIDSFVCLTSISKLGNDLLGCAKQASHFKKYRTLPEFPSERSTIQLINISEPGLERSISLHSPKPTAIGQSTNGPGSFGLMNQPLSLGKRSIECEFGGPLKRSGILRSSLSTIDRDVKRSWSGGLFVQQCKPP
ncbi:hypothetical protein O181_081910 [Austropuccinia psidii MF-1]|uniref:Uncharacterized protein n=1 Tax=Austropuccinia psidii MF-1 TaxID=1389203 RepID=A0A9Q3FQW3_9BASI|nr:hypothetical protein [Austropuccinia psidii MF-1]